MLVLIQGRGGWKKGALRRAGLCQSHFGEFKVITKPWLLPGKEMAAVLGKSLLARGDLAVHGLWCGPSLGRGDWWACTREPSAVPAHPQCSSLFKKLDQGNMSPTTMLPLVIKRKLNKCLFKTTGKGKEIPNCLLHTYVIASFCLRGSGKKVRFVFQVHMLPLLRQHWASVYLCLTQTSKAIFLLIVQFLTR